MKFQWLLGAALAVAGSAAQAQVTYLTDFAKDNNIYTNLNEQYPNTGPGVPGSGVGTPNASYLFTPPAAGTGGSLRNDVNNGISFELTSDALGHDFRQIAGGPGVTLPVSIANAQSLYLLTGAYFGTSVNVTVAGTGGATESFNNIFIPDFNGGSINSVSGPVADQTVFQVYDVGAGGTGNSTNGSYNNYSLTEIGLTLGSQFAGQTLQSATITANGSTPLLLGATVVSSGTTGTVPEPASWALMLAGFGVVGGVMRRRATAVSIAA